MTLFPCRHPDLEESLLNYFGDNSTPAHLKMADTPGDDTTRLIPCLADNGSISPFPLVAVRNVFVLPGGCHATLTACVMAYYFAAVAWQVWRYACRVIAWSIAYSISCWLLREKPCAALRKALVHNTAAPAAAARCAAPAAL
jgi:hypothetical protein